MVGATGFEPATPCAQGRCATRLRYAPTLKTFDLTAVPPKRPALGKVVFQAVLKVAWLRRSEPDADAG